MSDRMEDLKEFADQHIKALQLRFDTAQVFLTIHDPSSGETESMVSGYGNFLARYGHVREWLIQQEERSRQNAVNYDDEDDDE